MHGTVSLLFHLAPMVDCYLQSTVVTPLKQVASQSNLDQYAPSLLYEQVPLNGLACPSISTTLIRCLRETPQPLEERLDRLLCTYILIPITIERQHAKYLLFTQVVKDQTISYDEIGTNLYISINVTASQ